MRHTIILFICICVILTTGVDLFTQDHENVEQVGRIYNYWDNAIGITVQGDYAYVTTGYSGIEIVDVSDPESPSVVGHFDTEDYAMDFQIVDTLAYVADGSGGLLILNVRNPTTPELIAAYPFDGLSAVEVFDTLAYVSGSRTSLRVLDISDPNNANEIGSLNNFAPSTIFYKNGYLFCPYGYRFHGGGGFSIVRVRPPTRPSILYTDYGRYHGGIHVNDTLAIVSEREALTILDIRDRAHPEIWGRYWNLYRASGIAVRDTLAFVAGTTEDELGLHVIDFSDPRWPRRIGHLEGRAWFGIDIQGQYAYMAAYDSGLAIADIEDPRHPFWVGYYTTNNEFANDVHVWGDIAIVEGEEQVTLVDLSQPAQPIHLSTIDLGQRAPISAAIYGNYAYISEMINPAAYTIEIYDITNPRNPELQRRFAYYFRHIRIRDNLAYVTLGSTLSVLDLSDPVNPELRGSYQFEGDPRVNYLDLRYPIAAVNFSGGDADPPYGVRFFDVSNPDSLRNLGVCHTSTRNGLALNDQFAFTPYYIGHECEGISNIDYSNPGEPFVAGLFPTEHVISDLTMIDDKLIATFEDIGIVVYDVSDPENIREVGHYNTPGLTKGVETLANYAIVADYTCLGIYRYQPERPAIEVNPAVVDFDSVMVAETAELLLTVRNWGQDMLIVSDMSVAGERFGVNFGEEDSLEQDSSRDYAVTFSPDTAGIYAGTLTIVSNDPLFEEYTVDLSGVGVALEVGDKDNLIPDHFYLSSAYPNPFNSSTIITFGLPVASPVMLKLYDLSGREVRTLVEGNRQAGVHRDILKASDLPSGLYFVRLEASGQAIFSKAMLIR